MLATAELVRATVWGQDVTVCVTVPVTGLITAKRGHSRPEKQSSYLCSVIVFYVQVDCRLDQAW